MSKIYCADASCSFRNDKGACTAKNVKLSWHSVMTMWEGRQEYWKCKTREISEDYKKFAEQFEVLINNGK